MDQLDGERKRALVGRAVAVQWVVECGDVAELLAQVGEGVVCLYLRLIFVVELVGCRLDECANVGVLDGPVRQSGHRVLCSAGWCVAGVLHSLYQGPGRCCREPLPLRCLRFSALVS